MKGSSMSKIKVLQPLFFIALFQLGKYSSFNIYKPQVQGISLCSCGVVRRELCYYNYQNLPRRLKLGKSKKDKEKN